MSGMKCLLDLELIPDFSVETSDLDVSTLTTTPQRRTSAHNIITDIVTYLHTEHLLFTNVLIGRELCSCAFTSIPTARVHKENVR